MSFSAETRNELAHISPEKKCCMLAEISGFIRMCGSIRLLGGGKFQIATAMSHAAIARHYKTLIKGYFDIDVSLEVGQENRLKKGKFYTLIIDPKNLSEQILRETGILLVREGMNYISDGIYQGVIKTKCCRKAYLRGIFLASGTISDPEKGYHLEFNCTSKHLAEDVKRLINSFEDLHADITQRNKNYVVYVKQNSQIFDILAIMGAHSKALALEDTRMKKELRNRTNRIRNCDNANIDKALKAAEKQLAWIKKIQDAGELDRLPESLREAALLRLEHPEATLQELADKTKPPMKKSGFNNRFKRIEEIAVKLEYIEKQ